MEDIFAAITKIFVVIIAIIWVIPKLIIAIITPDPMVVLLQALGHNILASFVGVLILFLFLITVIKGIVGEF